MKRYDSEPDPWPKPIFSWKHENFNPYIAQKLQWLDRNRLLLMGSHTVSILHMKREVASSLGEIDPWHIAAGKKLLLCARKGEYVGLDSETYEIFRYRIIKRTLKNFPDFPEIDSYEVDARVLTIDLSPDDSNVVVVHDEHVTVLNSKDYSEVASTKITRATELVTFSPSGKLLAIIDSDFHLGIYELKNLVQIWASNAPVETPCVFTPDEQSIVFRNPDARSEFIMANLNNGIATRVIYIGEPDEFVRSIDISPDGLLLAAATRWDGPFNFSVGYLRLLRLHDGLEVANLQYDYHRDPAPVHVAFSTDAKHLAAICKDGSVRVWNVLSGGSLWRARKRLVRVINQLLARPESNFESDNEYEMKAVLRRFSERAMWATYMSMYSVLLVALLLGGIPLWTIVMWFLLIPGLLCCYLGRR